MNQFSEQIYSGFSSYKFRVTDSISSSPYIIHRYSTYQKVTDVIEDRKEEGTIYAIQPKLKE